MGFWTHDLRIDGAMLYQLSYEATQLGAGPFVATTCVPVKGLMNVHVFEVWVKGKKSKWS